MALMGAECWRSGILGLGLGLGMLCCACPAGSARAPAGAPGFARAVVRGL
jgi:hypothetical protein